MEKAAKGNEQITIVRGDLKRGIFHSEVLYGTFVHADFWHDIIPALRKHYRKNTSEPAML